MAESGIPGYAPRQHDRDDAPEFDIGGFLRPARARWRAILAITVGAGLAGYGGSFLLQSKYTATCVFLPPAQNQGGASAALASLSQLSALTGLGGGAAGTRNSPEQYIALMQSATVGDRIIDRFGLQKLWDEKYRVDARKRLAKDVDITTNKKDGLIKVESTDADPRRAAAIANQYVEELRDLTNHLEVTEAQQRRVFFENLLQQTRDKLAAAQTTLERSGFNEGALNSEPKSAASGYAELRAQLTAAEVRLQVLRSSMTESAAAVVSQRETVSALETQVNRLEAQDRAHPGASGDYVSRFREYKYQETLFDLFARQYESARVDESHEAGPIQVVDAATPPEKRSFPKRTVMGALAALFALAASTLYFSLKGGAKKPAVA
ncbi:MAG: Wzz/FepE/Etk N-terminal domain-containing protein [Burkholderiaceae bacterium]